jgi:putative addiction module killer protein
MYLMRYTQIVTEIRQTEAYAQWFDGLRDRQARARINARIRRLSLGNPGDVRPVGEGVSELRIDYGPGYRVYFVRRGQALVILLAGGEKRSQERDIKTALDLASQV